VHHVFLVVNLLAEKKQKKNEAASEKKAIAPAKPRKKPASMIEPHRETWMDFDRAFERFRRDFQSILLPNEPALWRGLPSLAEMEINVPYVDLEDKGDSFVLTAEAPGFKKDEIDINVCGNSVEISGCKETKTDEKRKDYVRKERRSESFYRTMTLPEEIKYEEVSADLKDGVLEITLPKKKPKPRKKVAIK
jgi:HSP20 family protein